MLTRQDIDCFFDIEHQGNRHTLIELTAFRPKPEALAHSLKIYPNILIEFCFQTAKNIAELRFYHNGQEVQNCGSGTLAAAHFCKHFFSGNNMTPTLKSLAGTYKISEESSLYGLTILNKFKYLNRKLNKIAWQKALVGHSQTRYARSLQQVGPYKLVEFPSASDIAALCPRFQFLANFYQGAIIATAPASPGLHADYVLRYFAPRYGNPEDAATGSANFVLLPYWQKRLNKNRLRGLQLSPQGGRFWGECAGNTISLFGCTRFV